MGLANVVHAIDVLLAVVKTQLSPPPGERPQEPQPAASADRLIHLMNHLLCRVVPASKSTRLHPLAIRTGTIIGNASSRDTWCRTTYLGKSEDFTGNPQYSIRSYSHPRTPS